MRAVFVRRALPVRSLRKMRSRLTVMPEATGRTGYKKCRPHNFQKFARCRKFLNGAPAWKNSAKILGRMARYASGKPFAAPSGRASLGSFPKPLNGEPPRRSRSSAHYADNITTSTFSIRVEKQKRQGKSLAFFVHYNRNVTANPPLKK